MAETTAPAPALSQRVASLGESQTLAITAKAKALQAEGRDVISFGAGEPDMATPHHIVAAAQQACADPDAHRYSPSGGQPELREEVAAKTRRDSGLTVDADEVVITNGAKHAVFNAFQTLIDPGDEVLLPAPYWTSYAEQARLAGGRVVELPTDAASGFRVSVDRLEAARTEATKLVVFTSPSNPTGAVYTPGEVAEIGRWAAASGLWVVTDEIYEHLVYDDAEHASMPVVAPEVAEQCVVVNGVSKTYAMTGWRVGWTLAPSTLSAAMVRLQSHATSNVANVSQAAALAALRGPLDGVREMRTVYDRRRRVVYERLNALEGVECAWPQGAFYAFPSVPGVLGRKLGGRRIDSAVGLCDALLEQAEVAAVPGEAFGAPGHLRLSYALDDGQLSEGLDRLAEALG
jgi:aspartate/methionine/tyrosine aminotransferase